MATVHDSWIYGWPPVRGIFAWPPQAWWRQNSLLPWLPAHSHRQSSPTFERWEVPLGTAATASLCLSVSGRQLTSALSPSWAQPARFTRPPMGHPPPCQGPMLCLNRPPPGDHCPAPCNQNSPGNWASSFQTQFCKDFLVKSGAFSFPCS